MFSKASIEDIIERHELLSERLQKQAQGNGMEIQKKMLTKSNGIQQKPTVKNVIFLWKGHEIAE